MNVVNDFLIIDHLPSVTSVSLQGFHFPEETKFHDFSRLRLISIVSNRPFTRDVRACSPRNFLIRILKLAINEFHATKFPFHDFEKFVTFSLTFKVSSISNSQTENFK